MKNLESIKQYSPCQCEGGGDMREANNGIVINPIPVENRVKTAGGVVTVGGTSHAYSSDYFKGNSITFVYLT